MTNNFKQVSWEEKARINPLYAVMTQDDIFKDYTGDPATWKQDDIEKLREKGRVVFFSHIYPAVLRTKTAPDSLVVEYGSGVGTILTHVQEHGYKVAGIDISQTMLQHSRLISPSVELLYLLDHRNYSGLPDNCASFVYSRAVFHHIQKLSAVKAAIKEIARITKWGGHALIHFHTQPDVLWNFEKSSILINPPRLIPHTNWVGVPLGISVLKQELHKNGMEVIHLEEHIYGTPGFMWALARKG